MRHRELDFCPWFSLISPSSAQCGWMIQHIHNRRAGSTTHDSDNRILPETQSALLPLVCHQFPLYVLQGCLPLPYCASSLSPCGCNSLRIGSSKPPEHITTLVNMQLSPLCSPQAAESRDVSQTAIAIGGWTPIGRVFVLIPFLIFSAFLMFFQLLYCESHCLGSTNTWIQN